MQAVITGLGWRWLGSASWGHAGWEEILAQGYLADEHVEGTAGGPRVWGGVQTIDTWLGRARQLGLARELAVDVARWLGHVGFISWALFDSFLLEILTQMSYIPTK
ncbi:hypothetical protein TIFTF001_017162 [Ficus carica]|uniref:Uncharacterized protein n=1 Tax=Ficus carica TaxID=3494 RepID=A0AA88D802_FICCA|nr:hypothetical protein TIFTF001_017162 [Ficus carica]